MARWKTKKPSTKKPTEKPRKDEPAGPAGTPNDGPSYIRIGGAGFGVAVGGAEIRGSGIYGTSDVLFDLGAGASAEVTDVRHVPGGQNMVHIGELVYRGNKPKPDANAEGEPLPRRDRKSVFFSAESWERVFGDK